MITSSVIIGLGSALMTGLFKLITTKMQDKRELREAELKALNAKATVTKEAREYASTGFQITRRIIAITTTICVMAIPFLAVLYYQYYYPLDVVMGENFPPIIFGYETLDKGFWPFTSDSTTTNWETFRGIVITPWHTEMFAWIMGMYFGDRMGSSKH